MEVEGQIPTMEENKTELMTINKFAGFSLTGLTQCDQRPFGSNSEAVNAMGRAGTLITLYVRTYKGEHEAEVGYQLTSRQRVGRK